MDVNRLRQAWSLLDEYYDFHRLAQHRRKLEEQLRKANIPLIHVPWKAMVRALLCRELFSDEQLKGMTAHTDDCCTEVDVASSEAVVNALLANKEEEGEMSLTETWFEVKELKERFQRAFDVIPKDRRARKEMLQRILGYPTGYSEEESAHGWSRNDEEPVDLTRVLTIEEQKQMFTGDLIELSGNRLHDAFYVYRLPQKGIWSQIHQMWSKHQITEFIFDDPDTNPIEEEIILIPAMDEYGYGVPYVFTTRPTALLPDGASYKYVDINCLLTSRHAQNPTIALVQRNLRERLKTPVYRDRYMDVDMSIDPDRFPQEYVALVHINDAPNDNVVWTHCVHYNGKEIARDLNDNREIFFTRRILEAEEQYRQKQSAMV